MPPERGPRWLSTCRRVSAVEPLSQCFRARGGGQQAGLTHVPAEPKCNWTRTKLPSQTTTAGESSGRGRGRVSSERVAHHSVSGQAPEDTAWGEEGDAKGRESQGTHEPLEPQWENAAGVAQVPRASPASPGPETCSHRACPSCSQAEQLLHIARPQRVSKRAG